MMRIAPAAKAFVFARQSAFPAQRNVAFTALRMMSSAAPPVKVGYRAISCAKSYWGMDSCRSLSVIWGVMVMLDA